MRLSRTTAYAIGASLQLADASGEGPIPCSQLARAGEMPERFLLQILRQMVNHGLLKSTRGVDGGYCLKRPAKEITLLQILEATDGPMTSDVPHLPGIPEKSRNLLAQALLTATRSVSEQLSKTSLADLCEPVGQPNQASANIETQG